MMDRDQSIRDVELGLLLDAIYLTYHYDFRSYSKASLERRVTAALVHFKCDTISGLHEHALGLLSDSLCRKGFLRLGLKETLRFSQHAAAFTELVPDARIYQKI